MPTLLLVLETGRGGPEGPVGFHLVTAPLALLQGIALAIAVHRGAFDFASAAHPILYFTLFPYCIGITALPFFNGDRAGTLAKVAMVMVVVSCFVMVNRLPGMLPATLVLALGAIGGLTVVAGLARQNFENSVRAAAADREQMSNFEESQSRFEAEQWAKLPENPELWQLLAFTHPVNKDLKQQCLAKIAALPDLEQQMIALLGTRSGQRALAYLLDGYPLRLAPLTSAYADFLDRERERWGPHLRNNPHAGNWTSNLSRHFEVADRILHQGGDLRAPLQRWLQLLDTAKGMGGLKNRVQAILQTAEQPHL